MVVSPIPKSRGRDIISREAMGRNILVVDDTEHTRSIVLFILNQKGFTVTLATNGEEALEKLKTLRPDLIVLDAMMPKVSGYEVCAHVKGNEATRAIPVIMLTAQSQQAGETVTRWRPDLRPDLVMAKPFKVQELLARVEEVLGNGGR
jgi:CheY-like chemotaxis protein